MNNLLLLLFITFIALKKLQLDMPDSNNFT
jgi:hypothetical protein